MAPVVPAGAQQRASESPEVLLDESFDDYRRGILFPVVGPATEYHYLREAAPVGPWALSNFIPQSGTQRDWRIIEQDGDAMLAFVSASPRPDFHPMVVAGDSLWTDYTVRLRFAPQANDGRSGLAFRYQNDRSYYFFGVEGDRAVLKRLRHGRAFREPNEETLTAAPFRWSPGATLEAEVRVSGPELRASFGNGPTLTARDAMFPKGKIALTADVPTRFTEVRVTATPEASRRIEALRGDREQAQARLQERNPKPVVWKKIGTDGFGVGRNLRFGDLDGDGDIDILVPQIIHHGPSDSNSEVGALTAITLEGDVLWQRGVPSKYNWHLTNDIAVQVHDLDADGRAEVVYGKDFQLVVADGATGETKYSVPMPENPNTRPPYDRFDRILGDAILFADLRGTGHPRDIILKDRYDHVWVFDERLNLQWTAAVKTGHYPYAADLDGDGADELMVGYSLLDGDGTVLWSNDEVLKDHADAVAALRLKPDGPIRLIIAASDEGIALLDAEGKVLRHHQIGHAQSGSIANYRDDLPGLEVAVANFWGNQGIIHLLDAEGNIIHESEPSQYGSLLLPVNWTGGSEELFLLSPDVAEGGLFDGWGRRAVRFPADGHPDMAAAALDLTGDARDEIVVWDPYEIWIYTQSDNPKPGPLYDPERNPLSNESNYRIVVSRP